MATNDYHFKLLSKSSALRLEGLRVSGAPTNSRNQNSAISAGGQGGILLSGAATLVGFNIGYDLNARPIYAAAKGAILEFHNSYFSNNKNLGTVLGGCGGAIATGFADPVISDEISSTPAPVQVNLYGDTR